MEGPFFSICIPAYNAAATVADTIDTMLGQTFQDWELIILNDCSKDNTWEIVKSKVASAGGDPRIRLLENPRNLGQSGAFTRLLGEARGKWVGILPADDGYRAHTLKTVHEFVHARTDLVLWCHTRLVVGPGRLQDVYLPHAEVTEFPTEIMAERLFLKRNIYGGMGNYLYLNSARPKELTFTGDISRVDIFFWIRFLMSNPGKKAIYHPDVLAYMTDHPDSGCVAVNKSGAWLTTIFTMAVDLLYLDWPARARLKQMVRIVYCWVRYFPMLPKSQSLLPARSLLAVFKSLFVKPAPPVA